MQDRDAHNKMSRQNGMVCIESIVSTTLLVKLEQKVLLM